MERKYMLRILSGILSGLATIVGASSVFQTASTAHVIAMIAGSFGMGVTVASIVRGGKKRKQV